MRHRHTNTCTSPGLDLPLISDYSRSEEPGVKGCRKKKKGKQHFWGTSCFPLQATGVSPWTSDGPRGPSWSNKAGYHRPVPKSIEVKGNICTDFSGPCSLLRWALGSRTEPGRAAWRRVHEGNIGVILWDVWVVAQEFMWKPEMWWLIKDKDSLKEKRCTGRLCAVCLLRRLKEPGPPHWHLLMQSNDILAAIQLAPPQQCWKSSSTTEPWRWRSTSWTLCWGRQKASKRKNAPKERLWCSWSSGGENTEYTAIQKPILAEIQGKRSSPSACVQHRCPSGDGSSRGLEALCTPYSAEPCSSVWAHLAGEISTLSFPSLSRSLAKAG